MSASIQHSVKRLAKPQYVRQWQPAKLMGMQRRWLNLHEYQSKGLMEEHGINVQKFIVVDKAEGADEVAQTLDAKELVVKAQIHAGGRGKGHFPKSGLESGVHLTRDYSALPGLLSQMIGSNLVTKQTPPSGVAVQKVMIAEALDIARETYICIILDPTTQRPVIIGSPMGGMDIERVAEEHPEQIFREVVNDIQNGPSPDQCERLARNLGFREDLVDDAASEIASLWTLFHSIDATQLEINPFGETPDGRIVAFDAKIVFDDSAAFRQKRIFAMGEEDAEEDPRETKAKKVGLNYIGMDGNIGCLVNGAGLAMATMDIIQLHGGKPANFLDVGGSATVQQVTEAFRIISSDEQVKCIFVNIFGGIMRCDTIAEAIVTAQKVLKLDTPIVVRLQGTKVDEARKIIEDAEGVAGRLLIEDDLDEAAMLAVKEGKT
ncbi:Succinate--CoA ligase [GDP-forming] subunit beta, mitochondrial [Saitoella coloradoensis]